MPEGSIDLTGKDRITVERDGEEIEVFNHVSVSEHHYVNSVNGYETFEPEIAAGDMGVGPAPDAVTERVAQLLRDEFGIDLSSEDSDLDIEVIDLDDDEVTVYA